MSSTVINTNVMSLNAQNNLRKSENALATSLSRLSSGLRINSARDDAAGLAISDRFTGQIRGNDQAIRNANDGISLAQVAESALSTVSNDLQRMRELAVQAANDTNAPLDRLALDNEFQQLIRAIGRISSTTEFNTRRLLDGTLTTQVFQTGANQGQTIAIGGVDARNTQLGGTEIVGGQRVWNAATQSVDFDFTQKLGLTEQQIKQGFEVKGVMELHIGTVRGLPVDPPLALKIDLAGEFNPDANAPSTNIVTLDDLSRVINSAIEKSVAGVEPAGTFGRLIPPDEIDATGNLAAERLKLAQANVSAAIVTRDDGTSTVIIRGAFGTEFELVSRPPEEVQAFLPNGQPRPVAPFASSLVGTSETEVKINTTGVVATDDVQISFRLSDSPDLISVTVTAAEIGLAAGAATEEKIAAVLNGLPEIQNLFGGAGATPFAGAAGSLTLTDDQGRRITNIVATQTVGGIATTFPVTSNESVATVDGIAGVFEADSFTGGDLTALRFTLGAKTYEITIPGGVADVTSLQNIIQAHDPALSNITVATGVAPNTTDLVLTDPLGRGIGNVVLTLATDNAAAVSGATISDLPAVPFNNPLGADLERFSMVVTDVGGIKTTIGPVDLTQVTRLDYTPPGGSTESPGLIQVLDQAIQAAGFTDIEVSVHNGNLVITGPSDGAGALKLSNIQLLGPDRVTIFNSVDDGSGTYKHIEHAQVNLTQIDITTRERATMALHIIDGALSQISDLRSELGAIQKRFESTVDNLGIYNVNLSASRSRIMDADFAAETAALTRGQILQQAGISTLAQANAGPQAVLALLQN